jgi:hypothetical protein
MEQLSAALLVFQGNVQGVNTAGALTAAHMNTQLFSCWVVCGD